MIKIIKINSTIDVLKQLLHTCKYSKTACLLVSNNENENFDYLLAYNSVEDVIVNTKLEFEQLLNIPKLHSKYWFGHITYNFKNILENQTSKHSDKHTYSALFFFSPKILIKVKNKEVQLTFNSLYEKDVISWLNIFNASQVFKPSIPVKLICSTTKQEYINKVNKIKKHIQRGDIYISNYCINFESYNKNINPYSKFYEINKNTKSPFAAFYKLNNQYSLCASPEKFISKIENIISSQPIKGTRKLGLSKMENEIIIRELANNKKEQNENVMTVDLVRNDLAKIAITKTVSVDKLFEVNTFNTLHHLVSSITAKLNNDITFEYIIKKMLPIASVTGTPKYSATNLMNDYENFNRSLYTGTIGYISPNGDFNFNVVIRTVLYNAITNYISLAVGSAITINCLPEFEYEECLLKANAILKVLSIDEC